MPKYLIVATRTTEYQIDAVDFPDEQSALASLDDWIADDFEEYIATSAWDFDVLETE